MLMNDTIARALFGRSCAIRDLDDPPGHQLNPPVHDTEAADSNMTTEDLYRMQRMQKSSLLESRLGGIENLNIKAAEHIEEYKQAFRLVHDEYADSGYVEPTPEHPFHYSVHSFLPETRVFIFQSRRQVLATLTQIFDTNGFGLPMDALYGKELDNLRRKNRRITELSALVTSRPFRMRNLILHLCKAMFDHSRASRVDDICIMVNPKHLRFYTKILLFEQFGPELFYEKVQAPAIPLRIDMNHIEECLQEKYGRFGRAANLHAFFCGSADASGGVGPVARAFDIRTPSRDVLSFFRCPQEHSLAA